MADIKNENNLEERDSCYVCESNLKDHYDNLDNKEKKNLRLR